MQEGRGQEVAHIVQITALQVDAGDIKLIVTPIAGSRILVNDAIWKLRTELDIAQFEFNRNHWAFKDRELFAVLAAEGYAFSGAEVARFENKQLPAPTRRELLVARNVITEWSHTELDDFLLEAGVTDLEASRAIGSRRDRANAIIEYVLANPTATTAENSMFSAFIVRVASKHHEQPNMGRHLLTKFIEEAELVTFAIVVMTDDDVESLKGERLAPRARQNVILELGYFLSHLGQQRVCALITPGLETPSDFDGIVYIRMDNAGNWKRELLRELRAAKMPLVE